MDNEIQAFDFMAAAEDTGRRLDEMAKRLPGEIRADLVAEYRQSPWQKSIPATADRLTAAAERAEAATGVFERKIKIAGSVACLAAVIVPLATWGYAYWQTAKLRGEYEAITAKTAELQGLAAALEDKTGGGGSIWKKENGEYFVALPTGVEATRSVTYTDGRHGFAYTWPPARK